MTNCVMKIEGARLDELSQQILVHLYDADEPRTVAEMKDDLGVQRQSIWYRLTTHLSDASLVMEASPDRRLFEDGPFWKLSEKGQRFVAEHYDGLAKPKSLEAVSEAVLEARREAESAKESVQGYRRKLYELRQEQEETEEVLKHITSKDHISRRKMVEFFDQKGNDIMQSANADVSLLESRIDDLRGDIEETRERVEVLSDYASAALNRAKSNEDELDVACRAHNNVHDRIEALEAKLTELEEGVDEMESGLLSF